MPLINLHTNVDVDDECKITICSNLSKIIVEATGKPEQYMMVLFQPAAMFMSGKAGLAAYADVRGIGGLSAEVNKLISAKVCDLLNSALKIPTNRIYLNFTEIDAGNWGWNKNTFG